MNKLEADSILFDIDGRRILSDIYLSCKKGQVIGILGRNGSGKSSLLKIIFGMLRAESQSIRFDQTFVNVPYTRQGLIKYLPQHELLPAGIGIRSAIELLVDHKNKVRVLSHKLVERNLNRRINEISGGERRFIETLLILFSKSDFVLLDEPFSYLAPVLVEELVLMIQEQVREKGIIITDHMYEHILRNSNVTYLIQQGVMKRIANRDDLIGYGYLSA